MGTEARPDLSYGEVSALAGAVAVFVPRGACSCGHPYPAALSNAASSAFACAGVREQARRSSAVPWTWS